MPPGLRDGLARACGRRLQLAVGTAPELLDDHARQDALALADRSMAWCPAAQRSPVSVEPGGARRRIDLERSWLRAGIGSNIDLRH
jgi:hypothetical protein